MNSCTLAGRVGRLNGRLAASVDSRRRMGDEDSCVASVSFKCCSHFGMRPESEQLTRNKCGPLVSCVCQMPGASPSGGVQIAKKLTNGFPPSVPEALAMGADERIDEVVGAIKAALNVDASVTLSAYDMAWIGRIPGTNCSTACRVPHFPQAIEWIRDNQLPDGSWEESRSTSAFERALATLASLVSLKTWGAAPESVMKGELFLQNCLSTMKPSDLKFVCAGFTHAFAALMEESSKVEIALPHANVFLDGLRSKRNQLLVSLRQVESIKRWPRKLLRFPEGFQEAIPWEEIRELQSCDGGLFASPAATACFAMNTGNSKALCYLSAVLKRSRCTEPTASLDRVSGVLHLLDHLERLNIDCHFHAEIGHLLDALHREALANVNVNNEMGRDKETQVMIFRALREHGYDVRPGASVFADFCDGTAHQEVMHVFGTRRLLQLYRASELMFPGEESLHRVKHQTTMHLKSLLSETLERHPSNVKAEVQDLLDFPYFMRYRLVESMKYVDSFEAVDETTETYVEWDFSRFMHAKNPRLVALARSNFNSCQEVYRQELQALARWKDDCRFGEVSFLRQPLIPSYLAAVGTVPTLEFSLARSAWTKASVLVTAVDDLFDETSDLQQLQSFVQCVERWDLSLVEDCSKEVKIVASGLLRSMDSECVDASAVQGRDLSHFFRRICRDLARSMMTEFEWSAAGHIPSTKEYLDTSVTSFATGPIVFVAAFFLGDLISEEMLDSDEYWDAFYSMSLFGRLINDISSVSRDSERGHNSAITVYLQEHPGQREEDALMAIKDMVTASASSALSKLLDPNFACSPIRVACLGLMRALFVMYHRNEDGFTNTPSDLKQKIERLFYVPFPTV